MAFQPPAPQAVEVIGPCGVLQGIVEQPGDSPRAVAVVCHPHPLQGGAMTNKVVHTLARSFNECNIASVRFNYRGVGASAGSYDAGVGETDDTLAVVHWAQLRWPDKPVYLAGFSFGGGVALRAALRMNCAGLITVAPAVARAAPPAHLPQCRWLLIQGDADEVIPAAMVMDWVQALQVKPELKVMAGAGHFFHGRLIELRELVRAWLQA
jgi:alpha/beta superfamily hydrolase